ncbi:hypothetical protein [Lysobacter antibioticus]|uniref:hypothetical protein n=1 Tax=Lysobacter antibioticus TaxID=84531 RepID=UPI0011DF25FC|nr:hypothetical protein [Lysobacter antibioticus]
MNNPIIHSSFFSKDGAFYMINATTSDHSFHAEAAVSKLYSSGGGVYLKTSGFGYSRNLAALISNYAVGYLYFGAWQINATGAAKINSGQMESTK